MAQYNLTYLDARYYKRLHIMWGCKGVAIVVAQHGRQPVNRLLTK